MTTHQIDGSITRTTEASQDEHDRLRAQRERIARFYGHHRKQPAIVMAVTTVDCLGPAVPPYAVRKQLREATLAVGRKAVARD